LSMQISAETVGRLARLPVCPLARLKYGVMEYWSIGALEIPTSIHHAIGSTCAIQHPAQCPVPSIEYPVSSIQNHRFVVGRRFPNFTSQGEFLVTCFLRWLHQSDWNVRQLPSRASSLAKSECSHRRSHHFSLLVLTPALAFLGRFIRTCVSV